MYTYDIWQWILFFYIYCFLGWVFESAYVSLCQRRFVNRGFLRLPMLPLYGSGAVMMLWVSIPVQDNLFLTWLFGAIGATALEYVVGVSMEAIFKVKYWDYSNQRFQFQGVICLSSTVAWGFLTILMTHVIHKPIERWVLSLPHVLVVVLVCVIGVLFVSDTVVSVKAALDLRQMLCKMQKIRAEFDRLQVQFALGRMEGRDMLDEWREAFREQLSERLPEGLAGKLSEGLAGKLPEGLAGRWPEGLPGGLSAFLKENREKLDLRHLQDSLREYDLLSGKLDLIKKSLLRAHPSATSKWFDGELSRLKRLAEERREKKKKRE